MNSNELEKLFELKKKGVVSEEEFEIKKKQILSREDTPKNTNKKAVIISLSVVIIILCIFALYYVLDNISPKLYTEQQIKCSNDICYNDKQKVINGKVVTYYPNQQIKTLKEYKNGKFLGTETGYYETGEVKYIFQSNNKKTFYKNGNPELEEEYDNKKIIKAKLFYENGNLESDKSFKDGNLVNEIEYYENGNIKYKNTKENKISFEEGFDEQGRIQFQRKFDNQMPLELKSFYENGFIQEHTITNITDGEITIPVDLGQKEVITTASLSVEAGTISSFYYETNGKLKKICIHNLFTKQEKCYPFNR